MTRSGVGTLGVGLALLALGLVVDLVELVVMGLASAGAVVAAAAWVRRPPPLAVRRVLRDTRVTVGDDVGMRLAVSNPAPRPAPALRAYDHVAQRPVPVAVDALPPGATTETDEVGIPTDRRGVVTVGPVVLERSDPFRFVTHEQVLDHRQRVYVRPRRHRLQPFTVVSPRTVDGLGTTRVRGAASFHRLREYVEGDDPRLIHWPTYARTRELVVREDNDTSDPDLLVVLDDRTGALDPGTFEQAVEVAASLVDLAHRMSIPVRLATPRRGLLRNQSSTPTVEFLLDQLTELDQIDGEHLHSMEGGVALVAVLGSLDRVADRWAATTARAFRWVRIVAFSNDGAVPWAPTLRVASAADFSARWNGGRL
jgi:uncharacterized protein (DUF58 family)